MTLETSADNISKAMKRNVILNVSVTRFFDGLSVGFLIPLAPLLAISWSASPSMATAIVAITPLFWLISSPAFGFFTDRISHNIVLRFGIFLNVIAFLIPFLLQSLEALIVSRVLSGIGSANSVTAGAMLANVSDETDRGKMMTIRQASFGLGLLIGPALVPAISIFDISYVFAVGSFLFLINLLMTFSLPANYNFANKHKSSVVADQNKSGTFSFEVCSIIFAILMVSIGFSLIHTALPLVISEVFTSQSLTGSTRATEEFEHMATVNLTVVAVLTGSVAALLSQILLSVRLISRFGPTRVMQGILLLWATGLFLSPLMQQIGWYPYLVTVVFTGASYGLFHPAASTFISVGTPIQYQGKAFGYVEAATALGTFIGPLGAGFLVVQSVFLTYWLASFIMAVTLLWIVWAIYFQSNPSVAE